MAEHAPEPEQFSFPFAPELAPKKIIPFPEKRVSPADALAIYALYPWKVGKPAAVRAITAALRKHPVEYIKERTTRYAELRGDSIHDFPHVPNPSTWFNQERFNDAEETWMPRSDMTPSPAKQRELQQAKMPTSDAPAGWEDFLRKSEFASYQGTFRHAPSFMKSAFAARRKK